MYKVLFEEKAEKTVESVQAAFERATVQRDCGYETIEDIEKAEHEGFLEFRDGVMTVYADTISILRNKKDSEFEEESLEGAKHYFRLDEKPDQDDYTGDDYEAFCRSIEDFNADLEACEDLESVADLLNSVTDFLGNGTTYYVQTIEI